MSYSHGRPVTLNAVVAGITRLRTKGGANPQSLYDAVNCYVTAGRTVEPRPGSRIHALLPAGTKGLVLIDNVFHVFASSNVGAVPAGYKLDILIHPSNPDATLALIHFAAPFMGYPYVVAEWSDGSVFHYWLQKRDGWQANKFYRDGDIVEPSVPNGFAYKATRLNPAAPVWAPDVPRAVNDRISPTVYSGYEFVVIDVQGANPKSGTVEPTWNNAAGAQTIEDTDIGTIPNNPGGGTGGGSTLPSDVEDRYDNAPWGVNQQAR